MVKIIKGESNRIKVSFPCIPVFVDKIKSIKRRGWHSDSKYCGYCRGKMEEATVLRKVNLHT